MTKYVFTLGGVVSSLGKGIASATLGGLLKARGYKVRLRKMDPYLNMDPGALNPYQRYEYLQVLVNPYRNGIKTGYLFLLLYCLERRLFEGNEEVIPVMIKIANFHKGKIQDAIKRTLKNYLLWKKCNK